MRIYYKNNSLKMCARSEAWRKNNLHLFAGYSAKYYLKNKAKCRAANRKWYLKNKKYALKLCSDYRKGNRKIYAYYTAKRRTAMLDCACDVPKNIFDILLKKQRGICVYCSKSLHRVRAEIDHIIPISRGGKHLKKNLQLLCSKCNRRKSAKMPHVFIKELKSV